MDIGTLLSALLKAFGVKANPEHIAQIEAIIPQVPAKAEQIIVAVNTAITGADERLSGLERRMDQLERGIALLVERELCRDQTKK